MALLVYIVFVGLLLNVVVSEEILNGTESKAGVSTPIIPKSQVPAIVGLPVNVSCFSEQQRPLKLCRWERLPPPNGKRYTVTLTETKDGIKEINQTVGNQDSFNCNCTYNYVGKGLDKGDCTMSINNVAEFHISNWGCLLVGRDDHTWIGSLDVVRYISKPYFKNPSLFDGLLFNETSPASSDLNCCVNTTDPTLSVNINISLEDEAGTTTTMLPREAEISNNLKLSDDEACRRSRYVFKPEDNGKRVICTSRFTYQSQEQIQTAFLPVNVKFGPKLHSSYFNQRITEDNSILVNITFTANPQPNTSWYLEKDPASGASFEIRSDHGKYKTSLRHLQGDEYSAVLEIVDQQPEDYRRKFLLKLVSESGTKDVHIQLASGDIPGESESDSYWITILMAIGVMIFLFVVAGAIFIVIKRRVNRGQYVPTQVSYSVANAEETEN